MKKSKLLAASMIVSFALLSVPSVAGPTEKKELQPVVAPESEGSFSDWFFSLFDF